MCPESYFYIAFYILPNAERKLLSFKRKFLVSKRRVHLPCCTRFHPSQAELVLVRLQV